MVSSRFAINRNDILLAWRNMGDKNPGKQTYTETPVTAQKITRNNTSQNPNESLEG